MFVSNAFTELQAAQLPASLLETLDHVDRSSAGRSNP